jgi:hypothetical protein
MLKDYMIFAKSKHYTCMVDLRGYSYCILFCFEVDRI